MVSDFDGMKWVRDLWGSTPRWTVDLDDEAMKQTIQSALGLPGPCDIKFLAEGAFNKLFIIRCAEKELVARVTMPIDPAWKTLSEVATLKWVRVNTNLPVPDVLAYQADRASAIGFEWIAMTKMPGKPLADLWRDISFPAKEEIVRQLASFCSFTFQAQMRGIGNLFLDSAVARSAQDSSAEAKDTNHFRVQRIVSGEFIWDGHIHQNVSRGPFASSNDWLSARLTVVEIDCRKRLSRAQKVVKNNDEEKSAEGDVKDEGKGKEGEDAKDEEDEEDEEDDIEELEHTLDIILRLRSRLAEFFPTNGPELESTMLFHEDLSFHNILVSEDGVLTAVVDWECVSTLPLWAACQYPAFLEGKPADEEPDKSIYQHDENGQVVKLFWEHLRFYELTQLRRLFLEEMRRLQPAWVDIFESSQSLRDFDLAVAGCDDSFLIRRIRNWLSDMDASGVANIQGLEERIDNGSL